MACLPLQQQFHIGVCGVSHDDLSLLHVQRRTALILRERNAGWRGKDDLLQFFLGDALGDDDGRRFHVVSEPDMENKVVMVNNDDHPSLQRTSAGQVESGVHKAAHTYEEVEQRHGLLVAATLTCFMVHSPFDSHRSRVLYGYMPAFQAYMC